MTVRTRAELETIFATLGFAHITPANMRDLLESIPLINEVGGVIHGPDLITGDSQSFLTSNGNWVTAGSTNSLFWTDEGVKKIAFSESDHFLEYFASGADGRVELTLTGVTLTAGRRYGIVGVFAYSNELDVSISIAGNVVAFYTAVPTAAITYELLPMSGYIQPVSNIVNPLIRVQQTFSLDDRLAMYWIALREIVSVRPMMAPLYVFNQGAILEIEGSGYGDPDHNFQAKNHFSNPGRNDFDGGLDLAGQVGLIVDAGIAMATEQRISKRTTDIEVTNTTLASTGLTDSWESGSDMAAVVAAGQDQYKLTAELWVLMDGARGVKFGFTSDATFAIFKGSWVLYDSTMARVAGGLITSLSDVFGFTTGPGSFKAEITLFYDVSVYGSVIILNFAQNDGGGSEGVHIQPGSSMFSERAA